MSAEQKKILIYARFHLDNPINLGLVKKYRGIAIALRRSGYEVDVVSYSSAGILFNEALLYPFPYTGHSSAVRNLLFNHLRFDAVVGRLMDFSAYSLLFIRFPMAHPGFLLLLRRAKRKNPGLKIVLEMPTYPFSLEARGFLRKSQLLLNEMCQPFLRRYIDKVVHHGDFSSLFGIPALSLGNGVDTASLPVAAFRPLEGRLRLLAVGSWNFWHALDRLIAGLAAYEKSPAKRLRINLTIVGEGPALSDLQNTVKEGGLNSIVHFVHGLKGSELDALFDETDVAIGTLGLHRKNVALDRSLKHREYCARGIPFVLSSPDPQFPPELPWVRYVPADESALQIPVLIDFFEKIKRENGWREEMRIYAVERLDWQKKLKKALPGELSLG